MSCYLEERDLYGWKCQDDARAAVSESSVLVAHFDDHFEKSLNFRGAVACVAREGRERVRERTKRKLENLKIKRNSICFAEG